MLLLVRHARPLVDEGAPPAAWTLSAPGKRAAQRIAPLIPASAVLVSSPEPKAYDTLVLASGEPVTRDARLGEVRRPRQPVDGRHEALRLRYVSGDPPLGWEPPQEVVARIDSVIDEHTVAGKQLVLAGHGMAFTTWLFAHGYTRDPAAFWSSLRFPDVLRVHAGTVDRLLVD
jgi:2,3-bisphosphoglycerate-dependent phosphoglycerate mutase